MMSAVQTTANGQDIQRIHDLAKRVWYDPVNRDLIIDSLFNQYHDNERNPRLLTLDKSSFHRAINRLYRELTQDQYDGMVIASSSPVSDLLRHVVGKKADIS